MQPRPVRSPSQRPKDRSMETDNFSKSCVLVAKMRLGRLSDASQVQLSHTHSDFCRRNRIHAKRAKFASVGKIY